VLRDNFAQFAAPYSFLLECGLGNAHHPQLDLTGDRYHRYRWLYLAKANCTAAHHQTSIHAQAIYSHRLSLQPLICCLVMCAPSIHKSSLLYRAACPFACRGTPGDTRAQPPVC
jgi:hypothetical protein